MSEEKNIADEVREKLFSMQDLGYLDFSAKLIPNIAKERVIGVRVPSLRAYAKELIKSGKSDEYIKNCPHYFQEENMLLSTLISGIKDYEKAVAYCDEFLPFVDNWAVCDILSPKVFAKNKEKVRPEIIRWIKSSENYTIRFGIEMAMTHFLGEYFDIEIADIISGIRSDEYYVNMMIAWYFATALAKNWNEVIPFIENHALDTWCERKTITKAVESYRITNEQKEYLKSFR